MAPCSVFNELHAPMEKWPMEQNNTSLLLLTHVTGLRSMVTIKMQQKQQQNARHYPLHIIYNKQIWLRATIYFILHTTKHQMFFLLFYMGRPGAFWHYYLY